MTRILPVIAHSDISRELIIEFRHALQLAEFGKCLERPARDINADFDASEQAIMDRLPELKNTLPKSICDACPDDRTLVLAVLKVVEENRHLTL